MTPTGYYVPEYLSLPSFERQLTTDAGKKMENYRLDCMIVIALTAKLVSALIFRVLYR